MLWGYVILLARYRQIAEDLVGPNLFVLAEDVTDVADSTELGLIREDPRFVQLVNDETLSVVEARDRLLSEVSSQHRARQPNAKFMFAARGWD